LRKLVPKTLRHGLDLFFFLMGWMIWKERNARIFNGLASSTIQVADSVQVEAR
jgi:hypothetical protein